MRPERTPQQNKKELTIQRTNGRGSGVPIPLYTPTPNASTWGNNAFAPRRVCLVANIYIMSLFFPPLHVVSCCSLPTCCPLISRPFLSCPFLSRHNYLLSHTPSYLSTPFTFSFNRIDLHMHSLPWMTPLLIPLLSQKMCHRWHVPLMMSWFSHMPISQEIMLMNQFRFLFEPCNARQAFNHG